MNKQQPLTVYYAWVVMDSDGREGVISAFVPGLAWYTALQNRDYDVVLNLGEIAKTHADRRGQEVRLVKFVRAQVLEGIHAVTEEKTFALHPGRNAGTVAANGPYGDGGRH